MGRVVKLDGRKEMTWPWWFVLGMVVIAAIITVVYSVSLESYEGYERFELKDGEEVPLYAVLNEEEEMCGIVVVHRGLEFRPPSQLRESLVTSLVERVSPHQIVYPVTVMKEPGYNSFRIYHKNREQFGDALGSWSHSVFHTMVLPIELVFRTALLPVWAMVDFVSHDQKVSAAIITPTQGSNEDSAWRAEEIARQVSVTESYDAVYVRCIDNDYYHFVRTVDQQETSPSTTDE